MAYPLRQYLPGVTYEITVRTFQRRFLLTPTPQVTRITLGIIGRALAMYPGVALHAFVFMSNHYHMHVTPSDGDELALFLGYLHSNVAKRIGALHQWDGKFWHRRASVIPILDDESLHERLRYLLLNGVKEGLVRSPRHWPGASALPGLLGDMRIDAKFTDHPQRRRAARAGTCTDDVGSRYEIRLAPYPAWAALTREEQRARCEAAVADAESHASSQPLGSANILQQDPLARPQQPASRTPAPHCHAATPLARALFRDAYRAFVDAFRRATQSALAHPEPVTAAFPPSSFPRPRWFRREDIECDRASAMPAVGATAPP